MLTTTSITAVSVSMRSAQDTSSSPDVTQRSTGTRVVSPPKPTCQNATHDSAAAMPTNSVVMISLGRAPMRAAEKAGDQRAEDRQEHDGVVDHRLVIP